MGGNAIDLFGKIENNSSNTQTFNLTIGTGGVSGGFIEIDPTAGDLNIGGSNVFLGNNQLRVWGDNGKTLTFGPTTIISGAGGSVAINQNSTVVFQSAHTYTGGTFVNAGALRFATGGTANSSTINILDTTGSKNAAVELAPTAGGLTLNSPIIVRTGSSGTATINALNTSGLNTLGGTVSLANALTVSTAAGGSLTLGGIVSGAGTLTKSGAGTLTLSAANTLTGAITINGGKIIATNTTALGPTSNTSAITVNTGGTLSWAVNGFNTFLGGIAGRTLNILGGTVSIDSATNNAHNYASRTLTMQGGTLTSINGVAGTANDGGFGNFVLNSSTILVSGTAQSTISATTIQTAGAAPNFNVGVTGAAVDLLVSSKITGAGPVVKNGLGTMQLSNTNTFSGGMTVNAGTIVVSAAQPVNAITVAAGASLRTTHTGFNTWGNGTSVMTIAGTLSADSASNNAHNLLTLTLNGGTVTSNNGVAGPANDGGFGNFILRNTTIGGTTQATISATQIAFAAGTTTVNDAVAGAGVDLLISSKIIESAGATNTIVKAGAGTMALTGTNTNSGVTTISAGTLQLGTGGASGSLGVGAVTNNATLAFNRNNALALNNVISGSGSVGQIGTGTTTLGAVNTYTGPTSVVAGKLLVNGSLAVGSAVSVSGGATLGGSGTINGTTTVSASGILESGAGNTTLTIGALTLSGGAVFNLTPNATTFTTPVLAVTNALTSDGAAVSAIVNIIGATPSIGSHALISYGSIGGTGGIGAFTLGTLPNRVLAMLDTATAGQVNLNVTAVDFPVWKGTQSSEWSTAVISPASNWVLNSNNGTGTDFVTGDSVLFNDIATNRTVDISVADVMPFGVIFNNSTGNNYTLTGTKGIAGATGLTKNGTGTLTIGTANSFSGPAAINAGTVSVATIGTAGANSPFGAGTGLSLGDATNTATLLYTGASESTNRALSLNAGGARVEIADSGANLTVTGIISGGGSLTKTGNGTLTLTNNANSFTGGTVVNSGTLALNGANTGIGVLKGTLTVNAGANVIGQSANALGWMGGANQVTILNINGGTFTTTANGDQGWGLTINMTGGTLASSGVGAHYSLGNSSIVNTLASAATATISGQFNTRDTSIVFNVANGAAATDLLFSGNIVAQTFGVGITKTGEGTMSLAGSANTYTGATLVNAGVLSLAGSISGSAVTVDGVTAILAGNGATGAVNVTNGGTLAPGNSPGRIDTLTLTMATGTALSLDVNTTTAITGYDQLSVTGSVTLNTPTLTLGGSYLTTPSITGDLFFVLLNDDTDSIAGTFNGLLDGSHVYAPSGQDFIITYAADSATSSFTGGNDIALMAVPEPGSAALLLGGLAMLGGRRRRK